MFLLLAVSHLFLFIAFDVLWTTRKKERKNQLVKIVPKIKIISLQRRVKRLSSEESTQCIHYEFLLNACSEAIFKFISRFSTKLLVCGIIFLLKEFFCGSMGVCNYISHLFKSKNKFFHYILWAQFHVSRPVFSIFLNSLSKVTDASTLKEETKLPFR